jgi:hypothetical protein
MESEKPAAPPEPEIVDTEFRVQIMGVQTMRLKNPDGTKSVQQIAVSYWFQKAPKANCKKCHGRGYDGKNAESGLFVPCSCVGRTQLHNIALRFLKFFQKKEAKSAPAEKL